MYLARSNERYQTLQIDSNFVKQKISTSSNIWFLIQRAYLLNFNIMSRTIESYFYNIDNQTEKEFVLHSFSLNHLDSFQVTTKRIVDLFLAIFFLVLVGSWLFILLAIIIKLESKGPVFFKQLRHGYRNKPFYCYKFRSMKYNPSGQFYQAQKNDPRITKVGKFLRMTSIDELPQIINIIKGEMSIVGPRPHAVTMNEDLSSKINIFMCRHLVKPGITGLAQCKGYRGEIKEDRDINFRLKYDLFYIKNWNVSLDLATIYWTIKHLLFNNENAY